MRYNRPHFVYHGSADKHLEAGFAKRLVDVFGQAPRDEADLLVSIGGDGLLMKTLKDAGGMPVYGVTPPGSTSRGFWTDHDVDGPEKFEHQLGWARRVELRPLAAAIMFENGKVEIRHAFNDVAIERASGQAVVMNITICNDEQSQGQFRVMGDGFLFSTALGSTGTNRTYNGPVVDIGNEIIITTGKGIYEPHGTISPFVSGPKTSFILAFDTAGGKRPVRIDCDGHSISHDGDGSPVREIYVALGSRGQTAQLLTPFGPRIRPFAAMMPPARV